MTGRRVVDEPSQLTPEWLTAALGSAGLDVTVDDLVVERIGTGQTGASFRLTPSYGSRVGGAPATLVAKLAAGSPEARRAVSNGFRCEVEFYRRIVDTVDVSTPRCWYAELADDRLGFTLLLDEVTGAHAGVQADGCTIDQAVDVLANAAGLHAPRWNDVSLRELRFLRPADDDYVAFISGLARTATAGFVERYADQLSAGEQATLERAGEAYAAWLRTRTEPFAVVHGDYRLDNFMFPDEGRGTDGRGVTVLDWQTLMAAPPMRDVAYFLGTCLHVDDRRAHERELLAGYRDALGRRGVGYDADEMFADYRLGLLQAPFITVIGAILATAERSESADRMFLAMASRSCAAIDELDPFALLV